MGFPIRYFRPRVTRGGRRLGAPVKFIGTPASVSFIRRHYLRGSGVVDAVQARGDGAIDWIAVREHGVWMRYTRLFDK